MKTYMRASLIISVIGLCVVLGLLVGQTFTATDGGPANRQTADIGRAFELVDDTGLRVSQDNLKGRYSLIYFVNRVFPRMRMCKVYSFFVYIFCLS